MVLLECLAFGCGVAASWKCAQDQRQQKQNVFCSMGASMPAPVQAELELGVGGSRLLGASHVLCDAGRRVEKIGEEIPKAVEAVDRVRETATVALRQGRLCKEASEEGKHIEAILLASGVTSAVADCHDAILLYDATADTVAATIGVADHRDACKRRLAGLAQSTMTVENVTKVAQHVGDLAQAIPEPSPEVAALTLGALDGLQQAHEDGGDCKITAMKQATTDAVRMGFSAFRTLRPLLSKAFEPTGMEHEEEEGALSAIDQHRNSRGEEIAALFCPSAPPKSELEVELD